MVIWFAKNLTGFHHWCRTSSFHRSPSARSRVRGESVLRGVNSSVLGNDTLDVSLGCRHEPEELCDELDLLSGVLDPFHLNLGHLAILHWDCAPFPVLNLRCGQFLLQSYPGLFLAGLSQNLQGWG